MKRILISSLLLFLLTSCSSRQIATPTLTPPPTITNTQTPPPSATPPLIPSTEIAIPQTALLFSQDFESGSPENASPEATKWFTKWQVVVDDTGNHIYCNEPTNGYAYFFFGNDIWKDYAVELQVKPMKQVFGYVSLMARLDQSHGRSDSIGYYGALNFLAHVANLGAGGMYNRNGGIQLGKTGDNWYKLRLELSGNLIKYFINNQLIRTINNKYYTQGKAGFIIDPGLSVCVDNIRAGALTANGLITQEPQATPETQLDVFSEIDVFPQVWSFNSPDDQSWEYKVNCVGDFTTLNTCFLWDVDQVIVTTPSGNQIPLQKDFNINSYSEEVTRRWVLYGHPGGGLPKAGTYIFTYFKNHETVLTQQYNYTESVLPWATKVKVNQIGKELHVSWTPPTNLPAAEMSYKVIITKGDFLTSQIFPIGTQDVILSNPPLTPGTTYNLVIMIGAQDIGFSNSDAVKFTWLAPQ